MALQTRVRLLSRLTLAAARAAIDRDRRLNLKARLAEHLEFEEFFTEGMAKSFIYVGPRDRETPEP